jgi:hypothetical protein
MYRTAMIGNHSCAGEYDDDGGGVGGEARSAGTVYNLQRAIVKTDSGGAGIGGEAELRRLCSEYNAGPDCGSTECGRARA